MIELERVLDKLKSASTRESMRFKLRRLYFAHPHNNEIPLGARLAMCVTMNTLMINKLSRIK